MNKTQYVINSTTTGAVYYCTTLTEAEAIMDNPDCFDQTDLHNVHLTKQVEYTIFYADENHYESVVEISELFWIEEENRYEEMLVATI